MTSALFLSIALANSSVEAPSYVYVSLGGEKRIAVYERDSSGGELKHRHDVTVSGAPGSLAVDTKRKRLFGALRTSGELAGFQIDAATGNLKPINSVSVGESCAYVATDRTGRFLFSAYYGAGKVMVHAIGEDGRLSEKPLQTVDTAEKAHAILSDPTNRFVFVPHTGPNAIFQFRFDEQTGKLAANEPPKVTTPENTGPRHLAFHPNLNVVYFDNEQGSSVTAFRLDKSKGTLEPFQTLPTLPEGFSERNSCADVEITPDGRFLYASNRGHDSLAGFALDSKTGKMTSLGQFSTEQTPRSFNITPDGKFIYAAGQGSGKLAAYRLDSKTGKLTRFATYEVGKGPAWVQVVELRGQ